MFLCSLLRNPVTNKPHYRLYVIHKLPQIRVLDFQRVKQRVSYGVFHSFINKSKHSIPLVLVCSKFQSRYWYFNSRHNCTSALFLSLIILLCAKLWQGTCKLACILLMEKDKLPNMYTYFEPSHWRRPNRETAEVLFAAKSRNGSTPVSISLRMTSCTLP